MTTAAGWLGIDEATFRLVLVLIPAVATACIGYFTVRYHRKTYLKSSVADLFKIIDESGHKTAEENLRDAYKRGVLMLNGKINPAQEGPASVVKKNYDRIGALMSSGLIPRRQYFVMYGIATVVSYHMLKQNIDQVRQNGTLHRAYFTNLALDCFEFWDNQPAAYRYEIKDPKGIPITKNNLGNRVQLPK